MFVKPKACAVCREPFTPVKRTGGHWSETCGSRRCRGLLGARKEQFRIGLAKATETRRAQRRARLDALAAAQFGTLSDREAAIWTVAEAEGYQRGYNARLATLRRAS